MLKCRQVYATVLNETLQVSVTRDCPQGGVSSPLLWDLVADDMLVILNNQGYYTQGYANDIVILILRKHANTLSELMQRALDIGEGWCLKEKLQVNPSKTALIPFTDKNNLEGLILPTFFNERLKIAGEVKYLGVIMDRRLTWNQYLENVTNKCKMALIVGRRTFGKTWGLKPRMVQRLYTAIVRSMIIYGSLISWQKVNQSQAVGKLSSVQSSACLYITGAIRSTHTAAMETLLNLSPLEIFIEGEARMGAHRLKCNDSGRNWNTGTPG
jgi:hypothetical protein